MSGKVKLGRPIAGTNEATTKKISFRLDAETAAALERLERELELSAGKVRGSTSIVLRQLILDAVRKLSD